MSSEHRWPLGAFLLLSALCLAVAVAGLGATAARLHGMPGSPATLLASGSPAHLQGRVLVGRTSAAIPVGTDRPVVPPTVALAASAPEPVSAPEADATATDVVATSPVTPHTRHHAGHKAVRHQAVRHQAVRHQAVRHQAVRHHAVRQQAGRQAVRPRAHVPRRWSAPGLRHVAHRAAPHRAPAVRVSAVRVSAVRFPAHRVSPQHGHHGTGHGHGHHGHGHHGHGHHRHH